MITRCERNAILHHHCAMRSALAKSLVQDKPTWKMNWDEGALRGGDQRRINTFAD